MASREFTSLSVSSYDAASLADQLTAKSAEGWEVVAIVPAGTNVTAYLSRGGGGLDSASKTSSAAGSTTAAGAAAAGAATESAAGRWGQSTESAPAAESAAQPQSTARATQPAAAAAATAGADSSAPAGWYADPAGRYELRYWDGAQWTEHVSRAGQQYTDPPVA
jgi:hypothetical protein